MLNVKITKISVDKGFNQKEMIRFMNALNSFYQVY